MGIVSPSKTEDKDREIAMLSKFHFKSGDCSEDIKQIIRLKKDVTVLFGIYNGDISTADHIGTISFDEQCAAWDYHVAGHGIAPKTFHVNEINELVDLILGHNRFFNLTDALYLQA